MIFGLFKQGRRQRLRARPFPSAWKSIITRNVPIFRRLPPADQTELLGCVQIFLAEKHFEGCGGLELTDEIRVTIAAQACLLLLHRETDYYPELTSILVYPSGYIAREDRYLGDNIWEQGEEGRFGHTGRQLGSLVLAWDEAKRGAADPGRRQQIWSCTSSRISSISKTRRRMARLLSRLALSTWLGRE